MSTLIQTSTSTSSSASRSSRISLKPRKLTKISIHTLIPTDFRTYYTSEVLQTHELTAQGRPSFTERPLIDWRLNDLRSLLIFDLPLPAQLRDAELREPGFRVHVIPRDLPDDQMVTALANTSLYQEFNFSMEFKMQTAYYTLLAVRERIGQNVALTRPQWRNVVENYLLNLGCEAQCRLDFRTLYYKLLDRKREQVQQQQQQQQQDGSDAKHHSRQRRRSSSSTLSTNLLRKAILTNITTEFRNRDCCEIQLYPQNPRSGSNNHDVKLTQLEKQEIWVFCQASLYKFLGLNWKPDELV